MLQRWIRGRGVGEGRERGREKERERGGGREKKMIIPDLKAEYHLES